MISGKQLIVSCAMGVVMVLATFSPLHAQQAGGGFLKVKAHPGRAERRDESVVVAGARERAPASLAAPNARSMPVFIPRPSSFAGPEKGALIPKTISDRRRPCKSPEVKEPPNGWGRCDLGGRHRSDLSQDAGCIRS